MYMYAFEHHFRFLPMHTYQLYLLYWSKIVDGDRQNLGCVGRPPPPPVGFRSMHMHLNPIWRFLAKPMHRYQLYTYIGLRLWINTGRWGEPPPPPRRVSIRVHAFEPHSTIGLPGYMPMYTYQFHHLYWSTIVGRLTNIGCVGQGPPPPPIDSIDRFLYMPCNWDSWPYANAYVSTNYATYSSLRPMREECVKPPSPPPQYGLA